MPTPYRLLITGSRNWEDKQAVWDALAPIARALPADQDLVLIHGGCPTGADAIVHEWARGFGAVIEVHPANWAQHGRKAGPIRNAEMVDAGADLALAFIKDGSRGASHTAALAEAAGIPVRRFTV